ncbi:NUDIX hydrolase [Kaistella jeonii]|uniref:NUDIX hydrolase n=1 Tax=Kaistella jeonii TaxID=266749 RepID=A0A0C1FM27_9FLAO|nr:CoA pyrophosphatase [Kaistella jeonii]KIA88989.1 NUDIX hydrolase [Kaistella jeonii]SFB97301.1 8-oxo-dGTP pyrophosphatase MutT, NUDIX family [Kaistella jeonii]VEI97218.1 putative NUDIX hydrolase [Kaistella jeonii]
MEIFGRDLLKQIQNAQLEGENAHQIYSPPYRPLFSYEEILTKDPKFAAVNILLYLKDNEWYFPLMVRTTNERDRHSGQISLPGGKKEEYDEDFAQTAKRETSEEMGIDIHYNRIIREMSPIYIPPSNFYVRAFVSYTKKNPQFILQKTEAVELIEFPVTTLLSLSEKPEMMILPSSRGVEVPVINFNNYIIWGATSMILSEFSHLLKNL